MVQAKKSKKAKRVIPGFGLSLGVTITLLSLVVLIPLGALVIYTAQMSPSEFWEAITRERVLASYKVSFITAFIASLINAVMGVILAWVLVRYKFPGERILDGMIELPFALPTAVAGIALTSLTADTGLIGGFFAKFGISIAYTRVGITVALVFVGIPFVTRAVQPVLEKLDPVYEEAAGVMGAGRFRIFRKLFFPKFFPRSSQALVLHSEDVLASTVRLFLLQATSRLKQKSLRLSLCRSCRNMTTKVQRQSHL